jgi:hypothetical protein
MDKGTGRIYLVPSEEWFNENWWPAISGAPLTLRDRPGLSLLTTEEASLIDISGEDMKPIEPFSLFVANCDYLLSDMYGSSVFVMTFENPIIPFRSSLPVEKDNVDYVPHMILSDGLALSKSTRQFLVSLANSLHKREVVFDAICIEQGDTEQIYNSHISTREQNNAV